MAKKMLTRDLICEWLNPILGGDTSFGSGGNILEPSGPLSNNAGSYNDLFEDPPAWLDVGNGCCSDDGMPGNSNPGDREVIGAMFINGEPLTSWGAMYVGNTSYQRKNVMNNYNDLNNVIKGYMTSYTKNIPVDFEDLNFDLTEITIQKIVPSDAGIGVNIYVKFKFNKIELFGTWNKWGVTDSNGYVFTCEPLKSGIHEETWIKFTGKLRIIIEKWMMPSSGIYSTLSKEVIIYNEYGQVGRLHLDEVFEVVRADKNKIQINYKETKWYIKTPTYWWFNYYFTKIK